MNLVAHATIQRCPHKKQLNWRGIKQKWCESAMAHTYFFCLDNCEWSKQPDGQNCCKQTRDGLPQAHTLSAKNHSLYAPSGILLIRPTLSMFNAEALASNNWQCFLKKCRLYCVESHSRQRRSPGTSWGKNVTPIGAPQEVIRKIYMEFHIIKARDSGNKLMFVLCGFWKPLDWCKILVGRKLRCCWLDQFIPRLLIVRICDEIDPYIPRATSTRDPKGIQRRHVWKFIHI